MRRVALFSTGLLALTLASGCALTKEPIDLPDQQILVDLEVADGMGFFGQRYGSHEGWPVDRALPLIAYGPEPGDARWLDDQEVTGGALRPPFRVADMTLYAMQGDDLVRVRPTGDDRDAWAVEVVLEEVGGLEAFDLRGNQAVLQFPEGVRQRQLHTPWDAGRWLHRGPSGPILFDHEADLVWVLVPGQGKVVGYWLDQPLEVPVTPRTLEATFEACCSAGDHFELIPGDEFLLVYHRGDRCDDLTLVDRSQLLFLARQDLEPDELPRQVCLPAVKLAHHLGERVPGGTVSDVLALPDDHYLVAVSGSRDRSQVIELDLTAQVARTLAEIDQPIHALARTPTGSLLVGTRGSAYELDIDGEILAVATTDSGTYAWEKGAVQATNAFLNGCKYVGIGLGYTAVFVSVAGLVVAAHIDW